MEEIATIKFRDAEAQSDACVVLRCERGQVAITLSLMNGGDVETFMGVPEAEKLFTALETALRKAKSA